MYIIRTIRDMRQYRVDDWALCDFLEALYPAHLCDIDTRKAVESLCQNPTGDDAAKAAEYLMLYIRYLW